MRKKGLFLATLMAAVLLASGCQKVKDVADKIVPNIPVVETTVDEDGKEVITITNPTDKKGDSETSPEEAKTPEEKTGDEEKTESEKVEDATGDKKTEVKAPSGTPYEEHGKLSVKGSQLVDKNGDPYQLIGISTHGMAWFPGYVNKASFTNLRDDFKANAVRLAMYTAEYNGYCTGDEKNKTTLYNLMCDGIDYATELGMYVIADWHILADNNPKTNQEEAKVFFEKLSKQYKDYDNIIYELCNEPNGGTSWKDIKEYAEVIIPIIRANDPDAIIIVGTPTWSQEVDKAAANPIKGYDNIMYTLHFYADTHRDDLRKKMKKAISDGLPIMVTEFGICDASGNGSINGTEAQKWLDLMNDLGVSYFVWNLSNKDETSALISKNVSKTSGWTYDELSKSGKWIYDAYNKLYDSDYQVPDSNTTAGSVVDGSNQTITTTPAPTEPDKVATSGNVTVTASAVNSWDGHIQYSMGIENGKSSNITGWKIVITFSQNIDTVDIWCANGTISGKTLTVTPVDYNNTIEAGKSYNDIGFIIGATDGFKINSIEVK